MKRILLVFGTRPEVIKMAPVVKTLQKYTAHFDVRVCVTGQHREMLDQVLDIFEIVPDYDLDIMRPGQDLYDVTANVLIGLREVLAKVRPNLVLVHGDTTTTMAASFAAFYARIPVGHVEAGLRTHNKFSPFPEEINRRVASCVCDLHFAPTEQAMQNLLDEGVASDAVHVTGNTVIDALFFALEKIKNENLGPRIEQDLVRKYPTLRRIFTDVGQFPNSAKPRFVLVTGHRRENFGDGFENICQALKELALANKDVEIVYPVHLNPNVQEPVNRILADCSSVHLIGPQDYLPFVWLMDRSTLIITDSGGVQEEAPSLGKPVLVMRNSTERPEAVTAGTVILVGTDCAKIVIATQQLLDDATAYESMSHAHNPYGDGISAERISKILAGWTGGIDE